MEQKLNNQILDVIEQELKMPISNLMEKEFKIPLRNKKHEIIGYALVDEADFERFSSVKWHKDKKGYVTGSWEGKTQKMHRVVLGAKKGEPGVDHINGNKFDNRRINLRKASDSLNAQNRPKNITTKSTSKYVGVSLNTKRSRKPWKAKLKKKSLGSFDREICAAFAYDQEVRKIYGAEGKVNGVEKPENYVEWVARVKTKDANGNDLPKNISVHGNKYRLEFNFFNGERYKEEYKTIETAIAKKQELEIKSAQMEKEYNFQQNNRPIERNKDQIAVIFVKDKEILVDDDQWHKFSSLAWDISTDYARNDGKSMHKLIVNANENEVVDHINRNPFDNRKLNLRSATDSQNAQNRTKTSGTSKFRGVALLPSNKFRASIKKDGVVYNLGHYDSEEVAAFVYDNKAKELYGEFAAINNMAIPNGWTIDEKTGHGKEINPVQTFKRKMEHATSKFIGVFLAQQEVTFRQSSKQPKSNTGLDITNRNLLLHGL
jgi:hypothetical protein